MNILLIVYDNDSYIHCFPIGVAYLVSALEADNNVDIYFQDMHHYSEEHLTRLLNERDYDIVGLSFIGGYYQYRKALKISEAINASSKRPFYIIGGHGPSPEPEFFMQKTGADAVCIGEGEETIRELVSALKNGSPLASVKGIAYQDSNGMCKVNPRRELIADIDSLPFPAYHRFPMEYYRLTRGFRCKPSDFSMQIISGRGCPFRCNFCYRLDTGFRPRSNESIIEEIKLLNKDYGITYISFFDDLLMSSTERTESFCTDLLKANVRIQWDANGRLNYAKPDLLRHMRKAGCVFLNYGIESFDDAILKRMHKGLTTKQIVAGVEATLAADISPGLNVIFGNHGENRETLRKGVEFILKYDDGAQVRTIRPVTPYPGSELYYDAIKMGKLKDCNDFYENKHSNSDLLSVNFTELSDEEFYSALHWANETLLTRHNQRMVEKMKAQLDSLYKERNAQFRGFRTT